MEVILLQKVANLGNIGDRVKVKPGYGRNFLLPQGKATLATADNVAKFEARRAELEKRGGRRAVAARRRARRSSRASSCTLTAKAGSEGKLFGSIGTADIAEALHARPASRSSAAKCACRAVRSAWSASTSCKLHLHTDVDVDLPVTIVAEE